MKKLLAFSLLITLLCMTACSTGNADETPVGGIDVSTEAPVTTAVTTEDPHAGWTWLLGEVYIPDLPFEDWSGQNQDNISCFTVFIKSRNSAAFHAYAQSLTDFGYSVEKSDDYSYRAIDPEGRKVLLTDPENGYMQISVYYGTN